MMKRNLMRGALAAMIAGALSMAGGTASASTVCDLRTALPTDATCAISGGLFATNEIHPAGTGYIDSFVRLQQNGYEQGYNTSARPTQFDEKTDLTFTHDLTLGEIAVKTINGVNYREFFLDINESAATNTTKPYLTLDQLEVFTAKKGGLTGYSNTGANNASGSLTGATKVYDMDTNTSDNYVQLNYNLSSSGSGTADMVFYIADSLFSGMKSTDYVTIYSQFGNIDGNKNKYASDAGFEEWFTKSSIPPPNTAVPEPATLTLLGSGLLLAFRRRLKASRS